MKREWKPGDVAMVLPRGGDSLVGIRINWGWEFGTGDLCDKDIEDVRPLVVIDPEDREQVERFAALYADATVGSIDWLDRAESSRQKVLDDMQAALREFASPTPPKPDEPQRMGSVVEDSKGNRWVRISDGWDDPDGADVEQVSPAWRRRGHTARHYAKVNAVRILSQGVTS